MIQNNDQLLVVAEPDTVLKIEKGIESLTWSGPVEAKTKNDIFKLLYTNRFSLVVLDLSLAGMDLFSVCAMINSHKQTHNPPILLISDSLPPDSIKNQFPDLYIDFLPADFSVWLFASKARLYAEFNALKHAVEQSTKELQHAYHEMILRHDAAEKTHIGFKKAAQGITMTAGQMKQPLKGLWAGIGRLDSLKESSRESNTALSAIKRHALRIDQLSTKALSLIKRPTAASPKAAFQLLIMEPSDEDYKIFSHLVNMGPVAGHTRETTLGKGLTHLTCAPCDLVIAANRFADGDGFAFLSRIRQVAPGIPVIFAISRTMEAEGPQLIAKGAYSFFLKEEMSMDSLSAAILHTLSKAKIVQTAKTARDRIGSISQKDSLTRLYNRERFEHELTLEHARSERYHTPFSVLILHFSRIEQVHQNQGKNAVDQLLSTFATLIRAQLRQSDTMARYDRERFAVLLPHTDKAGARVLSERIKQTIKGFKKQTAPFNLDIGMSIGLSGFDGGTGVQTEDLIEQANPACQAEQP